MEEVTYQKIEDNPNLIRDSYSKAIINTDVEAYEKYLLLKSKLKSDKKEIDSLKNEVSELKDLVKDLINKIG
jgi:uncharacterized coiled-coil DUF342 family protein|tara:strand:- start:63 stop:278 length:216 start_codon:yes stop_codon:yes gene_type:complete